MPLLVVFLVRKRPCMLLNHFKSLIGVYFRYVVKRTFLTATNCHSQETPGQLIPVENIIIYRILYTYHGNTQYYGELSKTPITNK